MGDSQKPDFNWRWHSQFLSMRQTDVDRLAAGQCLHDVVALIHAVISEAIGVLLDEWAMLLAALLVSSFIRYGMGYKRCF